MMRLVSVFRLLPVVILCLANGNAQPTASCNQHAISIPFLTKAGDGWDVTFAKEAAVIKKGPYMVQNGIAQQDSGLTAVLFEVKKLIVTLPHIEVNSCDGTGTIRNLYLMPKQVIGFERNGHLFAYQVWMQNLGGPNTNAAVIGSNMHVIFYDMHGDGVFDSVRIGSGVGMPLVPEWVNGSTEKKNAQ
jgi:hypothetical protein